VMASRKYLYCILLVPVVRISFLILLSVSAWMLNMKSGCVDRRSSEASMVFLTSSFHCCLFSCPHKFLNDCFVNAINPYDSKEISNDVVDLANVLTVIPQLKECLYACE
jgi:hypothetical protein